MCTSRTEKRKREPEICPKAHLKTLEKILKPVKTARDFFRLYDTLKDSGFFVTRAHLLDAWKRGGELFTLQILETKELRDNPDLRLKVASLAFPEDPTPERINLPVFCFCKSDTCIMLWTAPPVRDLGLATELVTQLGIKSALYVKGMKGSSRRFWKRLGIPTVNRIPSLAY